MSQAPTVLLLVGSPRKQKSTSDSLGSCLLDALSRAGWAAHKLQAIDCLGLPGALRAMLEAVDGCDLLALSFPLYVDCLPAVATRTLELIAAHRAAPDSALPGRRQRMLAIANCGFPDAQHNRTALEICRCFAAETGFEWAGGLAMGGGEALHGRPLNASWARFSNQLRALEAAAAALTAGGEIPEEAVRLMARPVMPPRLYIFSDGLGWRAQARQHGVAMKMRARPYQIRRIR